MAIDGLIENNRMRIRVLEEIARLLYREWFVQYRFPGAEAIDLVESDLGEIPNAWEVERLGDVLTLNYGKALKADDRRGGEVAVYGSGGLVGWHDEALVEGPTDDILVSVRAPCRTNQLVRVRTKMVIDRGLSALRRYLDGHQTLRCSQQLLPCLSPVEDSMGTRHHLQGGHQEGYAYRHPTDRSTLRATLRAPVVRRVGHPDVRSCAGV